MPNYNQAQISGTQNRRQKVFNRGALQFCGGVRLCGGLDIIKLTKTPLIYSVSRFNLGGLSPPKPPRDDGTGGTREGFFSLGTICQKTQKKTKSWKFPLIVMSRYCKRHWRTVLNLINNSLIIAQGTTVVISQWYWVFISQNRIHFKTQKNGFSRFFFSVTRNPGFLILPRNGNTTCDAWSRARFSQGRG